MSVEKRTCPECGIKFRPSSQKQIYCYKSCYIKAAYKRKKIATRIAPCAECKTMTDFTGRPKAKLCEHCHQEKSGIAKMNALSRERSDFEKRIGADRKYYEPRGYLIVRIK